MKKLRKWVMNTWAQRRTPNDSMNASVVDDLSSTHFPTLKKTVRIRRSQSLKDPIPKHLVLRDKTPARHLPLRCSFAEELGIRFRRIQSQPWARNYQKSTAPGPKAQKMKDRNLLSSSASSKKAKHLRSWRENPPPPQKMKKTKKSPKP